MVRRQRPMFLTNSRSPNPQPADTSFLPCLSFVSAYSVRRLSNTRIGGLGGVPLILDICMYKTKLLFPALANRSQVELILVEFCAKLACPAMMMMVHALFSYSFALVQFYSSTVGCMVGSKW